MASASASVASTPAGPAVTGRSRLPWRSAVAAGVVVTLVRPATWVVALAGFLAGGGVIALAWPIVVLPTPSGIQNLLGAPVSTLAFGNPSPELIRVAVVSGVTLAALFVAGLLTGAWAERRGIVLVLDGAAEEGYTAPPPRVAESPGPGAPGLVRIALIRVFALVPPLAAFAIGWPTLYSVVYKELILPEDLATPLPVRVIAQVPLLLAAIIGSWLLADAAAAVGVRRLVIERRGVLRAWALGWADLVRRPHRIIPVALLGDLALVITAGPALVAAALAWVRVREALELGGGPLVGVAIVAVWVAIWLGAVVLAGVAAAVRAALFTLEGARRR